MSKKTQDTPSEIKAKNKKAPSHVTVLGRKIPLVIDKPGKDEYGSYENRPHRIRLDDNLDPATFRHILTHEMVHAGLFISGIAGYHLSDDLEETICVIMESVFEDVYEALRKFDDYSN